MTTVIETIELYDYETFLYFIVHSVVANNVFPIAGDSTSSSAPSQTLAIQETPTTTT